MHLRLALAVLALWPLFGTHALASSGEKPARKLRLVILGDSLSAGFGVERELAYPALLQRKIDHEGRIACEVVNAGVSGDTSGAGLRRTDWVLRGGVDLFILELGGNDGLRGIPPTATKSNLQGIIDKVRKSNSHAQILIAGMRMPASVGKEYEAEFAAIFPDLAKSNGTSLIPFLLEGVAGDPKLNLPDMIHPTREGHVIIAETVWKHLKPLLAVVQNTRDGHGVGPTSP